MRPSAVSDQEIHGTRDIEALGIVVTKFDSRSNVHKNMTHQLPQNHVSDPRNWPPVFDTILPHANQIAAAAEHTGHSTLKQKWGYQGLHDRVSTLAGEILTKLGA